MRNKICNCEFYKQPVHISICLHGIIMETDTQCKKVVNITTALEIYSYGEGILCAMCCTVRTEQNLFLILDKYMDSSERKLN